MLPEGLKVSTWHRRAPRGEKSPLPALLTLPLALLDLSQGPGGPVEGQLPLLEHPWVQRVIPCKREWLQALQAQLGSGEPPCFVGLAPSPQKCQVSRGRRGPAGGGKLTNVVDHQLVSALRLLPPAAHCGEGPVHKAVGVSREEQGMQASVRRGPRRLGSQAHPESSPHPPRELRGGGAQAFIGNIQLLSLTQGRLGPGVIKQNRRGHHNRPEH